MRTPLSLPSSRRVLAIIASAGLITGCQKPTVTTVVTAATLTVVQGNNQTVQAGKELPSPIVFRVIDKAGAAMAGVPISLVVATGGGSVAPSSGVSDAKGEYSAKWTLGPSAIDNQLTATVPGLDPIKVNAAAILPSDIIIAQGNGQTAKVGTATSTSIVVRVVGAGNVPMVGVTVLFQVVTGGGSITPQSAVTSSLGEVSAKWTLGTTVGAQTALVAASTLNPANLTAIAVP